MPPKISADAKGSKTKLIVTVLSNRGLQYRKTIVPAPLISNDEQFLADRISDSTFKAIFDFFEAHKHIFHHQLNEEPDPIKALHVKSSDYPRELPRNIIIYRNVLGELRCLIPLKAKLRNGEKVLASEGRNPAHINAGGFRTVKYVVDLHTRDLYAETINKGIDLRQQTTELEIFRTLHSEYINSLVCYAQYTNSHGQNVTVTVSPYYKHGTLGKHKLRDVSDSQKLRIVLQILFGIKDIHDLGYCHNDLKPGNILIQNGLMPLIIDLDGMTRHKPPTPNTIRTSLYRAPETYSSHTKLSDDNLATQVVIKDPTTREYDFPFNHKANDIWALGIIIYQMIYADQFPNMDFIEQAREKITEKEITDVYSREKRALELLAYTCLRPQRRDRLTINATICQMFLLIAKNQLDQHGWKMLTTEDSINTEQSRLAMCELLFAGEVDLFYKLSLGMQKRIINAIAGDKNVAQFKKFNFYNAIQSRMRPLFWYFTVTEINEVLVGESSLLRHVPDRKEYRHKLRQIHFYLGRNTEDFSQLCRSLSETDLQATLVDYQQNQSFRYQGLLDFILRYNLTFPLSIRLWPLEYRQDFIKDLFNHPAHTVATLFLNNIVQGGLGSAESLSVVLKFLEKRQSELLNLELKYQLIFHTIKQAIIIYSDLSEKNQGRYKTLFLNYYLSFSSEILTILKSMLASTKQPLSFLCQVFKNLPDEDSLRLWIEGISFSDTTETRQFLPKNSAIPSALWTEMQIKIFRFIDRITNESLTAEEKLQILERLFEYVFKNKVTLYPLRHATFDAIGTLLGKGEKISKRGVEQLAVIRDSAYQHFNLVKQNKPEILEGYLNKTIFKAHRERGFFNRWRDTSHQKLIRQEMNRIPMADTSTVLQTS